MDHETGQQLLHYQLVAKIGQGGMGSVWRALDTTLDRDAAIKILPDGLANDPQFLARFEREAKLLASLSHPNLVSVFGVHESDSTRFIAMELVPGEDLSGRLGRGPMPIDDVLQVGVEIADALEAAHGKGVVHRDLKPANIRLTEDGRVKVLDFGLARTVEGDPASDSGDAAPLTATGVVMGTAPYMSPEQIRGERVDTRTDLWAFGCVLWECLTGQRPFGGATIPDQITSILSDEPDWNALPKKTPPSLSRLLRRCLAKLPRDRLHHAADARIELEESRRELTGAAPAAQSAAPAEAGPRVGLLLLVAAGAIGLGWLLAGLFGGKEAEPTPRPLALENYNFIKLTNFPGDELGAEISPDGDFVAFLSDRRGDFEAYVGDIRDEYRNLSAENSALRTIEWPMIRVRRIGFLGDGRGLWLGGGPTKTVQRVPLAGSGTTPWLQRGIIHIDWSPDGKSIVYSHSDDGDRIFLANANGTESREIELPTYVGYHQHFPTWSTDGRWIYIVRGVVRTEAMDLWRFHPDGRGLEQLTEGLRNIQYPAPIDKRTVLFVAGDEDGSGPWLWELDVETREVRRAHRSINRYTSISASRDGNRLVATVIDPTMSLFTVPILNDREATEKDVKPHRLQAVKALAPRVDGDRLYYLSSRGGGNGLWVYENGKSREIWSARNGALLEPAAISADGTQIAINVRDEGRGRLWVAKADGTDPKRLTDAVDIIGAASWSPDGDWIVVGGEQGGRKGVFKVRVADGRVDRLDGTGAMNPVWSPDGSMIVFEGPHSRAWAKLIAVTPEGKRIEDFPEVGVRPFGERVRFLPNGSGLVYMKGVNPYQEFFLLDLKTGESRKLTEIKNAVMRTFDITPDGKSIIFDRRHDNSDIVLIERDRAK